MVTALTMMGKRNTATSLDMEQAYETLRGNNALELNQEVLEQQIERLAEPVNEPVNSLNSLSEEELYKMPMSELERRAKRFL